MRLEKTRKPRIFVASVLRGLEKEREALDQLRDSYRETVTFSGWPWLTGAATGKESTRRARESDYLILILAGRYGTKDPRTEIGITEEEYEEFLYTHTVQYMSNREPKCVWVFQKSRKEISPRDVDAPRSRGDLEQFVSRVGKRHTITEFVDWEDLQNEVDNLLRQIPHQVPDKEYHKVSIHQFDFRVLGVGNYWEDDVTARWVTCPCPVHDAGGCDFLDPLHYRPPANLRREMQRHLDELWADRGMHFTPDYPTSCGWPVRLPRRCWTISE